ncbi:type III PLP-dependent enzyme domain-containing protein [Burkholderia alba]|uniref:PLP-dependent decarboxylase n=1 Tax=Burkholderia alba TaxID=2683677 RepID=UPI002B057A25|nr:PLP-dependent decarboxylase [Burkholderia alba]
MQTELDRAPAAPLDPMWLAELKTPCYVYDPAIAIARYRDLKARLGTRLIVSLKANPDQDMLARCAHAYEDGVELASRGELDRVVGRVKGPRYLNNPSMNEEFIRAGLASRCHFVLDNPDHVARFIPLARDAAAAGAAPGKLLLRLNAGALAGDQSRAHWHDHFGMTPNEAFAALRALAGAGLRIDGLHVFSGPHSFVRGDAAQPDTLALPAALAALARDLEPGNGAPLASLSLGGGFPEQPVQPEAFARYRAAIAPLAGPYSLAHESGRAIFADAGFFVTKVVAVKHWADRTIAVCDGGISHNFLLAQTESVIRRLQAPQLVRRSPEPGDVGAASTLFVGSTCSRADVIGRGTGNAPPRPGDLAVFSQCGAYHRTYSMNGFLSHEAAHVYIKPA